MLAVFSVHFGHFSSAICREQSKPTNAMIESAAPIAINEPAFATKKADYSIVIGAYSRR